MNKVVLIGNLTRDIELRYTQSGYCVGNSGIAVTRKFKNAQGQTVEETCFIDLKFFGRTAEIVNQYLRKGSKLAVEGRLKLEQWQDQSGQNRSKQNYAQSGATQSRAKKSAADKYDGGNDTIPF